MPDRLCCPHDWRYPQGFALSWVLFVDLVKAFDSVPLDVLFTVHAKFGGVSVIKRMNTDLQVIFDLNGEPVAVPWSTFCAPR